jgi:hypothetical protein
MNIHCHGDRFKTGSAEAGDLSTGSPSPALRVAAAPRSIPIITTVPSATLPRCLAASRGLAAAALLDIHYHGSSIGDAANPAASGGMERERRAASPPARSK